MYCVDADIAGVSVGSGFAALAGIRTLGPGILKVTSLPGIDNGRTPVDRSLIGDATAPVIEIVPFAPCLLTAQILVQIAA